MKATINAHAIKIEAVQLPVLDILDILEERISDWNKQKIILATVMLFLKVCRKETGYHKITTDEVQSEETVLVKMIQKSTLGRR